MEGARANPPGFLIAAIRPGRGGGRQAMGKVIDRLAEGGVMLTRCQQAQGLAPLLFALILLALPGEQGPVFGRIQGHLGFVDS